MTQKWGDPHAFALPRAFSSRDGPASPPGGIGSDPPEVLSFATEMPAEVPERLIRPLSFFGSSFVGRGC
jgi:hypothetical protein